MPKPPTTPGKPGKYKPETVVDPMVNGITILGIFESLSPSTLTGLPLLAASFVLLLGAGITACAVPIARALRVQPTEAIAAGG